MLGAGSSTEEEEEVCFVTCNKPGMRFIGVVKRNDETNEEYTAFYDVPYAKSPIGSEERYQAPKPVESPSIGQQSFSMDYCLYNPRRPKGVICTQVMKDGSVEGSADCLYLNIFLPNRIERIEKPVPVLVFFHGGEFTNGNNSPYIYTPDSIILHGVMFITVSYRVGLYGFFNMHTKKCPGNAGLKDQVRALEWIRDNIENFKGDPENVTISGSGAGATCVNLHLVAPMSRGLFHKAIVQSGGVYCPWGYQGHGRAMKEAITRDLECNHLLFADHCEQRLHERAQQLLRMDRQIRRPFSLSSLYGPTTETIKEGAFITEKLDKIMQADVDPKIPILAGITKNEGIAQSALDEMLILDPIPFTRMLADNFHWTPDTALKCNHLIKSRYLPEFLEKSDRRKFLLSKLLHDISFRRFYDNFKFGPERTLHKNLFVYQFEHVGELSYVRRAGWVNEDFSGSSAHEDELYYLYRPQAFREKFRFDIEKGDIQYVTEHICSLWANFCKDGVPSSEFAPHVRWKPHTEERPCYLRISTDLVLKNGRLCEAAWKGLNTIVNREPVVQSRPPTPK